ncbi:GDSL-type esterase/lipase family protein [Planctomicrobium sp. SH668]|uniref:GDSL-type esterase/lipase family protein n=1 Tax=Planctomicrobium sp. SH668 TaxID=3448126 RepID=UPI003F5B8294
MLLSSLSIIFPSRHFQIALLCSVLVIGLTSTSVFAENRFEKEIQKFESQDQKDAPEDGAVLFTGSSSIVLWDLKKSFPELDALNRGFGGSEISDSIELFPRTVLKYKPRQVVFYAGDNDLANGKSPEQVANDFSTFVGLLHRDLPKTPLVFISIKPSIARWNNIESIRQANQLIRTTCEKDPLLTYLDIDAVSIQADGTPRPEMLAKDGLHLTEEGYAVWNEALKPYLSFDQRSANLRTLNDRYHSWVPASSLVEWETQSAALREQLLVATGLWPLPEKTEMTPVIHGKIDRGDYTIEKVFFESFPGMYVTGNLYRPKHKSGKLPGVLATHGHAHNGRFHINPPANVAEELRIGGEDFQSGAHSYLQARAVQLARMGTVVFLYDMMGEADGKVLSHRQGFSDTESSLWLHNKLGLQTWNSIRSIDFLQSLPDVDPEKIAVTGESGGGTQTMLVAALDPRIQVAFPAVMVSTGMQGGCICENADYLRVGINNIAIAALCAPRPLAMSGANDWTIDIETLGLPELKQVYGFYDKADLVHAKTYKQFYHNYNQVARELMYDWFNTHLSLGLTTPVKQTDFWPLTIEEMSVYNDQHPRPNNELTEPELRKALRSRDEHMFADLLASDPETFRKTIHVARQNMLFPLNGSEELKRALEQQHKLESGITIDSFVVNYEQARIPASILSVPNHEKKKVVLWISSKGRESVVHNNGQVIPEIQKLLDGGYDVATAEVLFSGNQLQENNIFTKRMNNTSIAHQPTSDDVEYTGFAYGYNRTLIAERTRDIQAVVKYLKDAGYQHVTLVGTDGRALPSLLSVESGNPLAADRVIVDLQGFTFGDLKRNNTENMLPGALKYGGVGGLASVAYPIPLHIAGVQPESNEFHALKTVFQQSPEKLELSSNAIGISDIVDLILSK